MMRFSSSICKLAAATLAFVSTVNAQASSNIPTQTWNIAAATPSVANQNNVGCVNGLANQADPNGYYDDIFGARYAVHCAQDSDGFVYDSVIGVGTNGGGIFACFKGCDNRPNCRGFYFQGYTSSGTTGSGKCYFRLNVGQFYSNATVFGSTELISNGTPQLPCPYYNNTVFTDRQSYPWLIRCGYDSQSGQAATQQTGTYNMTDCMTQCNGLLSASPPCTHFSYVLSGAIGPANAVNAAGICYPKISTSQEVGGGTLTVALATRLASTPVVTSYATPSQATANTFLTVQSASTVTSPGAVVTSPSSSSRFSSSSTSTSTTAATAAATSVPGTPGSSSSSSFSSIITSATNTLPAGVCTATGPVLPSAPGCTGAAGSSGSFLTPCGTNYTVYCASDSNPGAAYTIGNVQSVSACMAQCDAQAGCVAATLAGTTCYLKTGYTSMFSGSGVILMVRYIPPNPNYAVPPPMGSINASTGCGKSLFGGLVAGGSTVAFNWTTAPDGFQRLYRVHIPLYYDPTKASPLIFGFSGNNAFATDIETQTRYSTSTLNPYGIAVYVQGTSTTTTPANGYISNPDYGPTSGDASLRGLDDLAFMKQFIPWLTNNFCIDVGRIWATGHSNGGGFVQAMACDPYLSKIISVFTGNSAAMYTSALSGDGNTVTPVNTPTQPLCSPGRNNVAYMEVHGTNDGTISYYGGVRRNRLLPTLPHWQQEWAIRQGYPSTNVTTNLGVAGTTGTGAYKYEYGTPLGILTHVMLINWVHDYATTANTGFDSSQNFMDFFYKQTSSWGTGITPAISSSSMPPLTILLFVGTMLTVA